MFKLQYLVHPPNDVSTPQFRERALGALVPELLRHEPRQLKLHLSLPEPPRLSVIPLQRRPLALVSIVTDHRPRTWSVPLSRLGRVAGYEVEESLPLSYQRSWPDGSQSPGVALVTLFSRRRGLSQPAFIQAWHGRHSPLSLEIHPLWHYVRNRVITPAVEGSPAVDAIVEEHFRQAADLLDPRRFFGGTRQMLPNMLRVAEDIRRFIALTSLRMHLMSEHWIKS